MRVRINGIGTKDMQPGDKIIRTYLDENGYRKADIARKTDSPNPPAVVESWRPVARLNELRPGERYRAIAPDGSGMIEGLITPRGNKTAMNDMRLMHGTRSIDLYQTYGWEIQRRVR